MPANAPTQKDIVLAALAASNGADFSPAQIQKLMFLIDENISGFIGGKKFAFKPYDYGPFDRGVYDTVESLERDGLTSIGRVSHGQWNTYRATPDGVRTGQEVLSSLPSEVSTYIHNLSSWVRSLSFTQLVSWIYSQYPAMKANSVFRG